MKYFHFITIFFLNSTTTVGQSIYLFIPNEHKPVEIEQKFRDTFQKVKVRAFGNVIDFTAAVLNDTPEAIVTRPQLIPYLTIYQIKLHAKLNGSRCEPFTILSPDNRVNIEEIDTKELGILDFMGRKRFESLSVQLFDVQPKFVRVKKVADLLPLLTMNLVDGIVVSASEAHYIRERSNMVLYETACKNEQEIAALAVTKEWATIIDTFRKLPEELLQMINIDGWE